MLLLDDERKELYYVYENMVCTNYTLFHTSASVRPLFGYDSAGRWGIFDDWPEDAEFEPQVELVYWKPYPESHYVE